MTVVHRREDDRANHTCVSRVGGASGDDQWKSRNRAVVEPALTEALWEMKSEVLISSAQQPG